MMQEISTQTAGILNAAKYNLLERHNTQDPNFNEFAMRVLLASRMRNSFRLTNIKSDLLLGGAR